MFPNNRRRIQRLKSAGLPETGTGTTSTANSPWQKCHFLDRRILPIRAGDSPRESFRIFPSGAIGRVEPREGGPEAQKRVSNAAAIRRAASG
jgi:hypothetical protein